MLLPRKVETLIKKMIVERYSKEEILKEIRTKYGDYRGLGFFYDCCYNTICKELGINRKKGEELKPSKKEHRSRKQ